jgi:hypothetical protein
VSAQDPDHEGTLRQQLRFLSLSLASYLLGHPRKLSLFRTTVHIYIVTYTSVMYFRFVCVRACTFCLCVSSHRVSLLSFIISCLRTCVVIIRFVVALRLFFRCLSYERSETLSQPSLSLCLSLCLSLYIYIERINGAAELYSKQCPPAGSNRRGYGAKVRAGSLPLCRERSGLIYYYLCW